MTTSANKPAALTDLERELLWALRLLLEFHTEQRSAVSAHAKHAQNIIDNLRDSR